MTLVHFDEVKLDWQIKKVFKLLSHHVCDVLLRAECSPKAWPAHWGRGVEERPPPRAWGPREHRAVRLSDPRDTRFPKAGGPRTPKQEGRCGPASGTAKQDPVRLGGAGHLGAEGGRAITLSLTVLCVRDLPPPSSAVLADDSLRTT